LPPKHDEGGDAERRGDEGDHAPAGRHTSDRVPGSVESASQEQRERHHRQYPACNDITHAFVHLLFHAQLLLWWLYISYYHSPWDDAAYDTDDPLVLGRDGAGLEVDAGHRNGDLSSQQEDDGADPQPDRLLLDSHFTRKIVSLDQNINNRHVQQTDREKKNCREQDHSCMISRSAVVLTVSCAPSAANPKMAPKNPNNPTTADTMITRLSACIVTSILSSLFLAFWKKTSDVCE
jgi:hypothetical protein